MTALLFIPSTAGASSGRRLDFASLASRFAEGDEPLPRRGHSRLARVALLIVILIGAIGDTVLVTRHNALTACLAATQPATS